MPRIAMQTPLPPAADKITDENKMNLAICMTCKNIEIYWKYVIRNIEKLSHYNLYLIFVYDNCNDSTGFILKTYKRKTKHNVYVKRLKDNNSYLRTVRIANARNECLKILYSLKDIKYHIFLDPDDKNSVEWVNSHLIDYYINEDKTWDCMTFNRGFYYDTWALNIGDFKWHSWGWGEYSTWVNRMLWGYLQETFKETQEDLICHSAFCGLAIFRTDKFKDIEYRGRIKDIPKNFFKKEDLNKSISMVNKLAKVHVAPLMQREIPYVTFDVKKLDSPKNYMEHPPVKLLPDEICEHIYYCISATRLNNCVIKISRKSLSAEEEFRL